MDSKKLFDLAKAIVVNYANAHAGQTGSVHIDTDEVDTLWASRKEDELKILLKTSLTDDVIYMVKYKDGEREAHLVTYKNLDSVGIRL